MLTKHLSPLERNQLGQIRPVLRAQERDDANPRPYSHHLRMDADQ